MGDCWRSVTPSIAPHCHCRPAERDALPPLPGDAGTRSCNLHRRLPANHRARVRTESPPTNPSSDGSRPNRCRNRDGFHLRGAASSDSIPTSSRSDSFRGNSRRQCATLWCPNVAVRTRIRHTTCTGRSSRPRPRPFANDASDRSPGMTSRSLQLVRIVEPSSNVPPRKQPTRRRFHAVAILLMSPAFSRRGGAPKVPCTATDPCANPSLVDNSCFLAVDPQTWAQNATDTAPLPGKPPWHRRNRPEQPRTCGARNRLAAVRCCSVRRTGLCLQPLTPAPHSARGLTTICNRANHPTGSRAGGQPIPSGSGHGRAAMLVRRATTTRFQHLRGISRESSARTTDLPRDRGG